MSVEARAGSIKAKRAFDLVAASLGLILLSPLLLAVAIAIRLTSRGPAIFRQWRHGRNGVPFQVYKFRTLHADAADATGVRQTVANDCRITPLGRFLRKANIDELPQLLNVIQGDMSLVGPRPHPIGMLAGGVPYEYLIGAYPLRHLVSPGLTGLAQVRGFRGPTTERFVARGRVFNDLMYVQHISVFLDLKIIWATIVQELRRGSGS